MAGERSPTKQPPARGKGGKGKALAALTCAEEAASAAELEAGGAEAAGRRHDPRVGTLGWSSGSGGGRLSRSGRASAAGSSAEPKRQSGGTGGVRAGLGMRLRESTGGGDALLRTAPPAAAKPGFSSGRERPPLCAPAASMGRCQRGASALGALPLFLT